MPKGSPIDKCISNVKKNGHDKTHYIYEQHLPNNKVMLVCHSPSVSGTGAPKKLKHPVASHPANRH